MGSENPQGIEERPLHPEQLTVWSALWSEDVIGLYFFENDCHRQFEALWSYDNLVFFLPAIGEKDLKNMWFQQDCATCHTTRVNMALLQEIFPGR